MLGRFFKPRWQHANPQVRCQAVVLLDCRDDAETLARLARGDESNDVRCAAAGRITNLGMLDEINQHDRSEAVRLAASQRIMALLAGTTADAPPVETRLRLVRLTRNSEVLAYVAEHSPDKHCRLAAVQALADDAILYRLAIDGQDEPLRLAASENITNLSLLKKLSREGRDKRVTRAARERAKVLQEEIQQRQARQAQQQHLAEQLEQHSRRHFDALFQARLEQLQQQWQAVAADAPTSLQQRVETALGHAEARLQEIQQQQQQLEQQEHAAAERSAALAALQQLFSNADAQTWAEQRSDLAAAMATQERRWQTAEELSPAAPHDTAAFAETTAAFKQLLALAEQAYQLHDQPASAERDTELQALASQWPTEYPLPEPLAGLARQDQAAEPAPPAKHKASPSPHRGLLVALQRELRQGNLRHANRLWHRAEALVSEQGDAELGRALEKLAARRAELQDWHAFAAEPKKVTLCEQMEGLVASPMDPQQLATAIQALHDEWRSLMSSDQDADQPLWERFKAASDQAYAPCRDHFAELDGIKKQNLQQRQALYQQLSDFVARIDWDRVDWEGLWQIRRQAPKDWKALQPVHFTDARELQKRFSTLLGQLDERLEQAEQAALDVRQPLLDQAEQLTQEADIGAACKQAAALQQRWKQAPWLPPARHRPLQKQFRQRIDRIFQARNAQQNEQKLAQQQQLNAVEQQLQSLESLLQTPPPEQDGEAITAQLQQLEGLAAGITLPAALTNRLKQVRQQMQICQQRRHQWQQSQQLQQHLDSLPVSDADSEAALDLAVAVEVLSGSESPTDQQQRRMAWQLKRLPEAMKRQDQDVPAEIRGLLMDYQQAISPGVRQRIDRALAALLPGQH